MNDSILSKQDERRYEEKSFDFAPISISQALYIGKLILFTAFFAGMVYLSLSLEGIMLSELLSSGGILLILFVVHVLSKR